MTFPSRRRGVITAHGHFAPELVELGRIEDDGNGAPMRIYNGAGQLMTRSRPALPSSVLDQTSPALIAARAALARHQLGGTPQKLSPFDRSWVGSFILTRDGAAARLDALDRSHGAGRQTGRGTAEYTFAHDSSSTVLEVDLTTGGPVSVVRSVNSVVVSRTTIDYDKAADGTTTRRHVRVEATDAGGSGAHRVIDTEFTNVQLQKRG